MSDISLLFLVSFFGVGCCLLSLLSIGKWGLWDCGVPFLGPSDLFVNFNHQKDFLKICLIFFKVACVLWKLVAVRQLREKALKGFQWSKGFNVECYYYFSSLSASKMQVRFLEPYSASASRCIIFDTDQLLQYIASCLLKNKFFSRLNFVWNFKQT